MLRLTYHEHDEGPDAYLFPFEAARLLRNGWLDPAPVRPDDGASQAARRVEAAMKEIELRFDRLRDLMGFPDDSDPDRPRAA